MNIFKRLFQYGKTSDIPEVSIKNKVIIDIDTKKLLIDIDGKRYTFVEENEINKIKEKTNVIGTVIGQEFDPVELNFEANTEIGRITLEPGTYILSAGSQVDRDVEGVNSIHINGRSVRFNCYAGGGACISDVITVAVTTTLKFLMYNSIQPPITSKYAHIYAVRVK